MSSRQLTRILLFTVVIASLVLAGCAQPAAPTEAPPAATEAPVETEAPVATEAPVVTEAPPAATEPPAPTEPPPPAEKKVATLIWTQEFDSLSPLYSNMWFVTTTYPLWNCAPWNFDDQNNPNLVLATEFPSKENGGISEDSRTITIKLRDDIKWSDGTPITSADFKFTFDMYMDNGNAVNSRSPYDLVETIETPDERTVAVTFSEPYAPWTTQLFNYSGSGGTLIPEHILKPVFDAEGTLDTAEWNKAPTVGCGPFTFAEWESGSFARFVPNENYWLGRPKLDEIFFRFVPDDASQIAALKAGDGDMGTFFDPSTVPELQEAGVEVIKVFSGYNEGLYFNLHPELGHPALKDLNVRKAIALGTDRQKLTEDLLLGLTVPAATDWDNTPWVDPTITAYPYDPEQAKALLDEAGWVDSNEDGTRDKDGTELVLKYGTTTREIRVDTQAVIQQQLQEIGIGTDLQNFDSDIFFAGYGENGPAATFQLDIFEYSNSPAFPDADSVEWLCSEIPSDENPAGSNWSGYCDEELDALFKQQAAQVDFTERQATFFQITRHIFDNVYWLGYWQDPDLFGINARLLNVKLSGASPFFNAIEWDIAQ